MSECALINSSLFCKMVYEYKHFIDEVKEEVGIVFTEEEMERELNNGGYAVVAYKVMLEGIERYVSVLEERVVALRSTIVSANQEMVPGLQESRVKESLAAQLGSWEAVLEATKQLVQRRTDEIVMLQEIEVDESTLIRALCRSWGFTSELEKWIRQLYLHK